MKAKPVLVVALTEGDFAEWKEFHPHLAGQARRVTRADDFKGLPEGCPIVYWRRWYDLPESYKISNAAEHRGCSEL